MAPMGKFKKLNCHNSGYTQDRVVIFGDMVGFSLFVDGLFNGII